MNRLNKPEFLGDPRDLEIQQGLSTIGEKSFAEVKIEKKQAIYTEVKLDSGIVIERLKTLEKWLKLNLAVLVIVVVTCFLTFFIVVLQSMK